MALFVFVRLTMATVTKIARLQDLNTKSHILQTTGTISQLPSLYLQRFIYLFRPRIIYIGILMSNLQRKDDCLTIIFLVNALNSTGNVNSIDQVLYSNFLR